MISASRLAAGPEVCSDGARVEGRVFEVAGSVAVTACCRRSTSASRSADVRRIRQLIELRQLTLPHMQAHGHEGIILVSLGPSATP
jgi:hypothetical protein